MNHKNLDPVEWYSNIDPVPYNRELSFFNFNIDPFWNHLNNEFFDNNSFTLASASKQNHLPRVDIAETENAFLIYAELPGVDDKNIDVTLEDGILIIKGEKKFEKENKKEAFYNRERYYGSFQRNFKLPETIDQSKIRANFDKGVLTVKLLKVCEPKKDIKKIPINN